jgi:hypothetical protein
LENCGPSGDTHSRRFDEKRFFPKYVFGFLLNAGGKKMRNIIVSEFVSLDGVMEDPAWTVPYWNDEIAKFKYNELFAVESLLLGRVTYQGFAEAWPSRTDPEGYAD